MNRKGVMSELCVWGQNHKRIEFLELFVMGDNEVAKKLYESLGFKVISETPKSYKYEDGSYQSNIIMRLDVR